MNSGAKSRSVWSRTPRTQCSWTKSQNYAKNSWNWPSFPMIATVWQILNTRMQIRKRTWCKAAESLLKVKFVKSQHTKVNWWVWSYIMEPKLINHTYVKWLQQFDRFWIWRCNHRKQKWCKSAGKIRSGLIFGRFLRHLEPQCAVPGST